VDQGKITLADAARTLIRRMDAGVLSTHSVEVEGYPFGSLTPFVASHEGRPVILISSLAQHTRNMLSDPRVCLTVYDPAERYKMSSSRVSILGNAAPVPDAEQTALADRYFAFFPHSRTYLNDLDFKFYWVEPHRVRFVSGFGRVHWLPKEGWVLPQPSWREKETEIIAHVNQQDKAALADMCRYFHQRKPRCAYMIAADPEGFHARADDDILYFVFEKTCFTEDELRNEIAKLSRQSRV
jgi:putative heme iron utilization protein